MVAELWHTPLVPKRMACVTNDTFSSVLVVDIVWQKLKDKYDDKTSNLL